MFKNFKPRTLHLETSSVCNAACPMCPREIDPGFNKDTDAVSLSLEQIQKLFNDEYIASLDSMFMCGNYGDPASAPDCLKIFRYFREVNPKIVLGMHSNASLRSKRWWAELGSILNQQHDYCYFSIDGLKDTNHIYRVNTDFDKIIENAKSFIGAGGKAHWEYLVFEHNEHQVDEARKLASDLGFMSFREKVSMRFEYMPQITHIKPPRGDKYK